MTYFRFASRRAVLWAAAAVLALAIGAAALARPLPIEAPAASDRSTPLTALALTGDVTAAPAAAPLAAPMARTTRGFDAAASTAALDAALAQTVYTLTLDRFATAQLDAFAVPGWQGRLYTVTFASADEAVCTVDAAGLVTGVAAGQTHITATAADAAGNTVSARCEVTVRDADPPITALQLVRSAVTLRMGGTGSDLTVTGCEPAVYFDYLEDAPAYRSSDEAVCTVDQTGHITAVAPGQAVVTVSLYGVEAECAVTVLEQQVTLTGGIRMLNFPYGDILAIGNQSPGRCSWYAMRYARTVVDGTVCSGKGMWSNGAIWSAGGFTGYSADLAGCLDKLYSELNAGRPVIVHLQNTHVDGARKHANRITTYEYHANGSGGWQVVEYPHIATSAAYGHWVCVVGYADSTDPANLRESDFYALDPARVSVNGTLVLTRLMDGTLWTANSPLKVLG